MLGSSTVARSRRGLVVKPVKRLQKGQLDDVASRTLELVQMNRERLEAEFSAHTLGLRKDEFMAVMMAVVYSGNVSLSEFYITEAQSRAHLQYIFDDIDTNGIGRVSLSEVEAHLEESHWRYVHRREQRTKLTWNPVGADEAAPRHQLPSNENNSPDRDRPPHIPPDAPGTPTTGGSSCEMTLDNVFSAQLHEPSGIVFGLKEDKPRPALIAVDAESRSHEEELVAKLGEEIKQAAMTDGMDVVPYPTALAVLPELDILVVATTCNNGSHLHAADPQTGEILHTTVVDSHQTSLSFDPTSHTICGGSSLGEVSFWSYNVGIHAFVKSSPSTDSLEHSVSKLDNSLSRLDQSLHSGSMLPSPAAAASKMARVPSVAFLGLPSVEADPLEKSAVSVGRVPSVAFLNIPDAHEIADPLDRSSTSMAKVSSSSLLKRNNSMSLMGASTSQLVKRPIHFEGSTRPHNGPVVGVATMKVHAHVVSVGEDGKIALVDPLFFKTVRFIVASPKRALSAAAFDPVANFIATCSAETTFQVWHGSIPEHCEPTIMRDDEAPHQFAIESLAVDTPRHHVLSLDVKGTVKVWDLRLKKCLQTFTSSETVAEQRMGLWKTIVMLQDGVFASCSDRSTHLFQLQKGENPSATVTQCDMNPIISLRVTSTCSVVAAASKCNVRLYNTGSGSLQQSLENVANSKIASCAIDEVSHSIVIGETNGDVAGFSIQTGTELWRHHNRHSQAVGFIECGDDVVFSCGAEGVITSSRGPAHRAFAYEEKQVFPLSSFFLDAYEVFGITTTAGTIELYEIAPDGGNDEAQNILKAHTYDISDALMARHDDAAVPSSDCLCFLGSIGHVMVAEGATISMLALSTTKVTKIVSWESANYRTVTYLGYIESKNQLVVADDGSNLLVYDIAELMATAAGPSGPLTTTSPSKNKHGAPSPPQPAAPTVASFNFRAFNESSITSTLLLKRLGVLAVTGDNLECRIFRPDGVKRTTLDMFSADRESWEAIADEAMEGPGAKKMSMFNRRRSTIGGDRKLSVTFGDEDDPLAASERKVVPKVKRTTAMCHGSLPQLQRTAKKQKPAAPANAFINSLTSSFQVAPNVALTKYEKKVEFHEAAGKPPVRPKKGETSGRTSKAQEIKDAKWSVDYIPPKERGPGVLMAMRTMTKGLLPSSEVVEEYQHAADARFALSKSPMKDPATLHGTATRKPHRLESLGRPVQSKERITKTGAPATGSVEKKLFRGATTPSPVPVSFEEDHTRNGSGAVEKAPQWMKHHGTRQTPTGGGFRSFTPAPTPAKKHF